jgi:hypothetical protein
VTGVQTFALPIFILPLILLMTLLALIIFGCTSNVNDNKPFDATESKLNDLSPELLRAVAKGYKQAIVEHFRELDDIIAKECGDVKGEPPSAEQMKRLYDCLSSKSGKYFWDRLDSDIRHLGICVKKLKEKGCDTSDLDLESILNERERKLQPKYKDIIYPDYNGIRT